MDRTEYLASYCASIDCTNKKLGDCDLCMYEKGRADTFKECIDILKGIDKQVADIFENIVMNAEHYNKKGK